jgi:hypothetical protein
MTDHFRLYIPNRRLARGSLLADGLGYGIPNSHALVGLVDDLY